MNAVDLIPLVDSNNVITTGLIVLLSSVPVSLITAYFARPKTKAEAENLQASTSVSVSGDARAWSQMFVERTQAAEVRSDKAEERARRAEERVDEVEARATQAEERNEERFILMYGYVRKLRQEMRDNNLTPSAPPPELEVYWNGSQ